MENLTQKEPVWRENGKGFVESVTRLLERLLDYRNVGQVSRYRVIQQNYMASTIWSSVDKVTVTSLDK